MPSWFRYSFTVATTDGDITILRATYGSPTCGEQDVTQKLKDYVTTGTGKFSLTYRNINFQQLNQIFGDNCVGHPKALNFWYRKKTSGDVLLLSVKNNGEMEEAVQSLSTDVDDEETEELY
jgi:hypothetical protein